MWSPLFGRCGLLRRFRLHPPALKRSMARVSPYPEGPVLRPYPCLLRNARITRPNQVLTPGITCPLRFHNPVRGTTRCLVNFFGETPTPLR